MKTIRAVVSESREVTIPEQEARRVAIETIQEACNLGGGTYIESENGKLCYEERNGGGSHSWFDTVEIRKATKLDKAALMVIAKIKSAK